jgi:endoglucanase
MVQPVSQDRDTWVTNPNYEWCQPAEADQATAAADRFAMLNYAVDKLKENPATSVYLDGTHSSWLGAGDAADRLIQAGGRGCGRLLPERLQLPPEPAPGEIWHLDLKNA